MNERYLGARWTRPAQALAGAGRARPASRGDPWYSWLHRLDYPRVHHPDLHCMNFTYVVTGGAGFIGSNLVHALLARSETSRVVVYDRLTYAGNLENLANLVDEARYSFVRGDICDRLAVRALLFETKPDIVFNLAAESHVDRSIDAPGEFVRTNVAGTFELLDAARALLARPAGQGWPRKSSRDSTLPGKPEKILDSLEIHGELDFRGGGA